MYLNEVGIRLGSLVEDIEEMTHAFVGGRRLYLVIRNEQASEHYTTDVLARLFEEEGGDAFDVREAYIGHLQQGGTPTAFDRLLACRLMSYAIDQISEQLTNGRHDASFVGLVEGRMSTGKLAHLEEVADLVHRRPYDQGWMPLLPIIDALASPSGSSRSGEPRLLPQE